MSSVVISATTSGPCECCGPSCSFTSKSAGGSSILSSSAGFSAADILVSFGSFGGFTLSGTLTITRASWSLAVTGSVPATIGGTAVNQISLAPIITPAGCSAIIPASVGFPPGSFTYTWSGTFSRSQSWFQGSAQEFVFDAAPIDGLAITLIASAASSTLGTGIIGKNAPISFSGVTVGTASLTFMEFPVIPTTGQFDGSVNFQVCRATGTLNGLTVGGYYVWQLPSQYRAHGSGGPWIPDTTNLYEIGVGLIASATSEILTIDMLCGSNPGSSCPGPTYGAGDVDVEPIGPCTLTKFF